MQFEIYSNYRKSKDTINNLLHMHEITIMHKDKHLNVFNYIHQLSSCWSYASYIHQLDYIAS